MAEHKVVRVGGESELASKLDELTSTGWEVVSVMLGQPWGAAGGAVQVFFVVARKKG